MDFDNDDCPHDPICDAMNQGPCYMAFEHLMGSRIGQLESLTSKNSAKFGNPMDPSDHTAESGVLDNKEKKAKFIKITLGDPSRDVDLGCTLYPIFTKSNMSLLIKHMDEKSGEIAVFRRYSEFRKLYKSLITHSVTSLDGFPSKSYFNRYRLDVVNERRIAFQKILDGMVRDPVIRLRPELIDFLTPD